MRILIFIGLSSFAATLSAQSPSPVTSWFAASSHITCIASGFVSTSNTIAPGILPPSGSVEAEIVVINRAYSATQWDVVETETSWSAHLENLLEVTEPTYSWSASTQPQNFLIHHSSATPIAARLELHAQLFEFQGGNRTIRVDYGNDGTYEVANLLAAGPQQIASADLSTDPIVVRIRIEGTQSGLGWSRIEFDAELVPDVPIAVTRFPVACDTNEFSVEPTFDNTGVIAATPLPLSVTVFGFSQQPQALPLAATSSCLLLPTPDVVIAMTAGVNFPVALPAAVRPITLSTQLVSLTPQGLTSSDALQILAW